MPTRLLLAVFAATLAAPAEAPALTLAVRSDGGLVFALLDAPSAAAVVADREGNGALPPLDAVLLAFVQAGEGEIPAGLPPVDGAALGLVHWSFGAGPVFSMRVEPVAMGHGYFDAGGTFFQDELWGSPFAVVALPTGVTSILLGADTAGHDGFVLGAGPQEPPPDPALVPAPGAAALLSAGLLGLGLLLPQARRRRAIRAGAAATSRSAPQ